MSDNLTDFQRRKNRDIAGKILTVILLAILGFVIYSIAAKDKDLEEDGVIVLKMWDIPRTELTSAYSRSERAVHEEFLRRHPEIKTVMTRGILVEGPARESAFYMAMAGGTAPDVFRINMRSIGSYIDEGFVRPLDDFVASWPDAQGKIRDAIRPALCRTVIEPDPSGAKKAVTHIYGVPYYYDVMGFYYRKALFQQAGLPVDGCPPEEWTWDKLWEYGRKCTWPEDGRWGLQLPMGLYGGWMWMNFIWQADADIVKQYGVHPRDGPVHRPAGARLARRSLDHC